MNDNLKRLMVEADYPAPEIAQRAQKLVKLVIQECCSIADEVERADTGMFVSWYLKAHFGVEE